MQSSWEKACATGALVGLEHLLSVIRDGTADDIRARFDRLRERAPDPRMTMIVPLFANELHLRSDQARAVWTAFFKLVVHTGDPRAAKPFEKLAALAQKARTKTHEKFEDYLVKQIPATIDKLPDAGAYAATQLYARSPELLGHANLVSLRRLGRMLVPNVASTTGPVGFDYFGPGGSFDWEETLELAKLVRTTITHLETGLVDELSRAYPDLDTVVLEYSWSTESAAMFEPLIPWVSRMRVAVFQNIMDSREADDGWFVDRLPNTNVHFVYGGGELYRSYVRRDGGLHAVFTDTSTKGGFSDGGKRDADWIGWRTRFFKRMPTIDSLTFRQRSTWSPVDVEAVAACTKAMKNVTLPKAKRGA